MAALVPKEFNVDAGGYIRGKKFIAHGKKCWTNKGKHPRIGFKDEGHGENVYVLVHPYISKGSGFDESADPVSGR